MYLPLDDLEAMMNDANETSYEEAVDRFIAENGERIDYWVTGEMPSAS
jgi:glycine betaine/proline transport system substrate-binding protein